MPDGFALFVGQFLRNPGEVRSLVPSSRALGLRATETLSARTGLVVELGAGTGTITRCILERGIPGEQLVLMEMNPTFCTALRKEFPGVQVINAAAQTLDALPLPEAPGAVVSGLPILAMPISVQHAIMGAAFSRLKPGAHFMQLTYGLKPPVAPEVLNSLGLRWRRMGRVWRNFPPAEVFCFYRPG